MIKTFTPNDVIRYFYKETSEKENKEIENAMLFDSELRDTYFELCVITKELDKARKEPSDRTVNKILQYSQSVTDDNLPIVKSA